MQNFGNIASKKEALDLNPYGLSNFLEAYAHGISLLIDHNERYNSTDFKIPPQYLHLVIASEEDRTSLVTK